MLQAHFFENLDRSSSIIYFENCFLTRRRACGEIKQEFEFLVCGRPCTKCGAVVIGGGKEK